MKAVREIGELLLVLALVGACHAVKKTNTTPMPQFDVQGHRGCRGLMPENTIAAMLKAVDLGVTTLEMDAVITKDKKVILSHEPFFNHEISTKPGGKPVDGKEERTLNIYKLAFAETQLYDVGLLPHPRFPLQQKIPAQKPLLATVIDSVKSHCEKMGKPFPFFNIETKCTPSTDNLFHPAPEEFVDLLMEVITDKKLNQQVIIQSFDYRTLQYLHSKFPAIKTAALVEDFDKKPLTEQLKQLGFVPSIYSPHYSLVNEELVRLCHEQGMRIIPWTVNDKPAIENLKKMGVDGIISDYPDLF